MSVRASTLARRGKAADDWHAAGGGGSAAGQDAADDGGNGDGVPRQRAQFGCWLSMLTSFLCRPPTTQEAAAAARKCSSAEAEAAAVAAAVAAEVQAAVAASLPPPRWLRFCAGGTVEVLQGQQGQAGDGDAAWSSSSSPPSSSFSPPGDACFLPPSAMPVLARFRVLNAARCNDAAPPPCATAGQQHAVLVLDVEREVYAAARDSGSDSSSGGSGSGSDRDREQHESSGAGAGTVRWHCYADCEDERAALLAVLAAPAPSYYERFSESGTSQCSDLA